MNYDDKRQRIAAARQRPGSLTIIFEADIHQVYRALSLLAKESDEIQVSVYKNSLKLGKRRDAVIYYDCSNYESTFKSQKSLTAH